MKFYVGLHHPADAKHFDRAFISINTIRRRKKPIGAGAWIMDSGAFTEVSTHGKYRTGVEEYAVEINRWDYAASGIVAAVAQDFMCEPWIVEKTGLTVADHQRMTIERYDALLPLVPNIPIMPVLQGFTVESYVDHVRAYGDRLKFGAYVGVGSVCKRNSKIAVIEDILRAIKRERPDLRLHGFGLKATALSSGVVLDCLESADSMAWSYAARREGRDGNNWREAKAWEEKIARQPVQMGLDL